MAGPPAPARRRATISQVAELAGVSKATVSKAFNNRGGVSDETRDRVLRVADSLGWRPSARAVALTSGGAGAVGFVLNRPPDLLSSDPYFGELISGIERTLAEHGFWLMMQIAEHADAAEERHAYADLAQTQRVDGVFLAEPRIIDQCFDIVTELGLPAVIVSRPWGSTGIPWEGAADPGGGVAGGARAPSAGLRGGSAGSLPRPVPHGRIPGRGGGERRVRVRDRAHRPVREAQLLAVDVDVPHAGLP